VQALVDGGHYTLRPAEAPGEPVVSPDGTRWSGTVTDTTCATLRAAAREVQALRGRGSRADLALMVGDLAVPAGLRAPGGPWALPAPYREILAAEGLAPAEVRVLGEAFCRNQGKRRLLDEARARAPAPERTYAEQGWALLADPVGLRLASDAALEWDAEVRVVALTRGPAPLCPLVFAGLKRWAFRNGYDVHVACYALDDDPYVDAKLRAGAAAVAQLLGGAVGEQIHRIASASGAVTEERFAPDELVAPGECTWDVFFARARAAHPGICRIEEAPWRSTWPAAAACGTSGGASSRCSA